MNAVNTQVPQTLGHFINGRDVADDTRSEPVTNPATGDVVRHVPMASKSTVEDAIAAAASAFPAWRDTPPIKRARIMFRFKQLLDENADAVVRHMELGEHIYERTRDLVEIKNVEIHGPEAELSKLRNLFAEHSPRFFTTAFSFRR